MKRTLALGAAAALGGATLLAGLLWRDQRPPVETPVAAVATPSAPVPAALPGAGGGSGRSSACVFEAGEQAVYGVSLTSTTQAEAAPGQPPLDVSLSLSGQLHLEAVETSGPDAVLLGRLMNLSVAAAGLDAQALSRPFLVKIDPGCRLVAFARQLDAPRGAARNVQALLWEAQFEATPSDAFRMENGNGVVTGRMEQVAPGEFRRTLTSYASLWQDRGAREVATDGALVVRRGSSGWLETLDASETLRFGGARTQSRLSLSRAAPGGPVFSEEARTMAGYVWENLLPLEAKDLISRPVTKYDHERRARVSSQTPREALDAFVARKQQGVGIQETWPDLAAYFEVHPDAIAPAVERYLAGELPVETTAEFFLALGKARVPEAREALLTLKRDERRVAMDRVRSMFALVVREDVGPALATELAHDADRHLSRRDELAQFLGGEALLSLSMMSGTRSDPQVTSIATASVGRALASLPPSTHGQRATLGAVGNLGQAAMLPAARPYINASDPKLRRAATRVFGRIPPPDSEGVALEWLRREDDPLVKRDLWDALQQQHFDAGKGAGRALVDEAIRQLPTTKSAYTRRAMVRLLAQSEVAQAPDVRQALVKQARWERDRKTTLLNEFQRWLTQQEVGEVLK